MSNVRIIPTQKAIDYWEEKAEEYDQEDKQKETTKVSITSVFLCLLTFYHVVKIIGIIYNHL